MTSQVVRLCGVLIYVALLTAISPAASGAEERVFTIAIVGADGASAPTPEVEPLLLARFAKIASLRMVEREVVSKALDELKLSAAGLTSPDSTLKLGKLAAADALVLLDREAKINPPLDRVRIVEVRTGVRLFDWSCQNVKLAEQAPILATDCAAALRKLSIPDKERRYLSMLGLVTDETGDSLTPTARALTVLVEAQLQQQPSMVMLERDQLQQLQKEQALTGIDLNLRASTLLIDGGLHRTPEPGKLAVTLRLTQLQSGKVTQSELETSANIITARDDLAGRLAELLKVDEVKIEPVPIKVEVDSLLRRALALDSRRQSVEALPVVEAALALMPDDLPLLEIAYKVYFASRLNHGAIVPSLECSQRILRCEEIDLRRYELNLQLPPQSRHALLNFRLLHDYQIPRGNPAAKAIARQAWELNLRKYKLMFDAYRAERRDVMPLLLERLEVTAFWSTTAEDFTRTMKDLQRDIECELVARDGSKWRESADYLKYLDLCCRQVLLSTNSTGTYDKSYSPREMSDLLESIRQHQDPLLQIAGIAGDAFQDGEAGDIAIAATLTRVFASEDDRGSKVPGLMALIHMGVQRQKLGEKCAQAFVAILDRAETQRDATALLRWHEIVKACLAKPDIRTPFPMANAYRIKRKEWSERVAALLASGPIPGNREPQAVDLRSYVAASLRRIEDERAVRTTGTPPRDELPERRAKYAEGPWANYTISPLPITNANPTHKLRALYVDRQAAAKANDEELILIWAINSHNPADMDKPQWIVSRMSARGGALREVGRFRSGVAGGELLCTPGGSDIFVANSSFRMIDLGIQQISKQSVERFDESRGAPGARIKQLVWLKDKLYLLYDHALVQFDPGAKTFEMIASDRSLNRPRGLNKEGPLQFYFAAADEQRECLAISMGDLGEEYKLGIFRYSPEMNRFALVMKQRTKIDEATWNDGQYLGRAQLGMSVNADFWLLDFDRASARLLTEYAPLRRYDKLEDGAPHPEAGSAGVQPPAFVMVGEHIFGLQQQLLAPDGKEYQRPEASPLWWRVERHGPGFIAATKNALWYVVPRETPGSGEPAAQPSPPGTK